MMLTNMKAGKKTVSLIARSVGTATVTAVAVLGIVATTLVGLDDVAEDLMTGEVSSTITGQL